ncbi:leader peptidase (prepilin peptidase)/N-methyltransferase [Friedmanniella endophytica]|uniref:Leader peptidase (Prepilin peptidase)/N-methyltransferase n=1 Tax=Microlunatus kandeliicorticis TaxID=1759536 RepID=A0A7W3P4N7_9ACTN|nr:leader peptidase (prepilin peptidase)/N-methyltransferase [Microlunatus kandeliicorticis]
MTLLLVVAGGCALAGGFVARTLPRWLPDVRRPTAVPTAVLAAGLGAAAVVAGVRGPALVGFGLLAVGLAALVLVDVVEQRLPDRLVGATAVGVLVPLLVAAAVEGRWPRLGVAALTAVVITAGYFALAWVRPDDLGLGDVKLAGVLGLALGWLSPAVAVLGVLAGFGCGAVAAVVLLATRRVGRRGHFAFGPCMVAGAALAVLLGRTVLAG